MEVSPTKILALFGHRTDVFAVQSSKGAYFPSKREITVEDVEEHLFGEKTIGLYCLKPDNTVKWCCVDLDKKKACSKCGSESVWINEDKWHCNSCGAEVRDLELVNFKKTAKLVYEAFPEFPRILEFSGRKGYHIWIFFETPTNASFAQHLVKARIHRLGVYNVEVFPKQTELNEGRKYGNLVKIPFALHKVSNQKSRIIKSEGVDLWD